MKNRMPFHFTPYDKDNDAPAQPMTDDDLAFALGWREETHDDAPIPPQPRRHRSADRL